MKMGAARAWRALHLQERLQCIVIESGSSPLAESNAEGFDETVAIAQLAGECPALFAQRILARIASVERSHRHFEAITLLTNEQYDRRSKAARQLIILGLSAHARAHGQPVELTILAPATSTSDERAELLQLAGEATEASPTLLVRLRFGERLATRMERRSGVFPKSTWERS
jgi:hypothetical protein